MLAEQCPARHRHGGRGRRAPEKRSLYLERIGAMVNMRGRRFTDDDLAEIARLACTGLVRQPAP
jgi:hypothetical protein